MTKNKDYSLDSNLISTTDLDGNITYANDVFCSIAGYKYEELIGEPHNLCSGQVKLATVLYSNQYCCSARLGGNPSLC